MRYTCNKKSYPDLSKDCLQCPKYNACVVGGKWYFVGLAETAAMQSSCDLTAPMLRDTSTITIHVSNTQSFDVSREDIKEQFKRSFYANSGLGVI